MKHLIPLVAITALTACQPASSGTTYITSANTAAQINVSATGQVDVAPDRAIVTAGVFTQDKTARGAMMANATMMTAVYEELEAAGIARKNITTSQLSLQPRMNYANRQAPKIDGYNARNTVTVKTDDIEQVGPLLDALVSAGVNNINGVQFTVKDPKSARDKARTDAIREAREKAESMAEAAGVDLGALTNLNESGGGYTPQPVMMMARSDSAMGGTPMSQGEQTISVTVNLTYAIAD
ncbi:SIMPL domain-containing protein [Litorimonas sp. RW-G-Af-16]|uniref:SIMPL domain-containing protein n=1 Tax=Litorimonas sp. RW-G-Af-16 TaxID=3241168 RepID=UPI00390CD861